MTNILSLSEREGLGLLSAEAMASSCYVVGYIGLAGQNTSIRRRAPQLEGREIRISSVWAVS